MNDAAGDWRRGLSRHSRGWRQVATTEPRRNQAASGGLGKLAEGKGMKGNSKKRRGSTFPIAFALGVSLWSAFPLGAGKREPATAAVHDEFFVISSVDTRKNQIVLKRPTEVTELVRVTDKTLYLDAEGRPLRFQDLRAGDTVYVASSAGVATRIRKGPMTVEELHRRYLKN